MWRINVVNVIKGETYKKFSNTAQSRSLHLHHHPGFAIEASMNVR